MPGRPTVFVVDRDRRTLSSVGNLARMMNLRCRAYTSGRKFLKEYNGSQPGCVVLEVKIPDLSGLEIQRRLAAEGHAATLVFLTSHRDVSIAVQAMRAGAVHFLEKPFRTRELWDAIEEAVRLDRQRRRAEQRQRKLRQRLQAVTPKQRQVLKLIAKGKSTREIAANLGITVRGVELRRQALMKTLKAQSLVELVYYALVAAGKLQG